MTLTTQITSTNSPVQVGALLRVNAEVSNTGDTAETQTVTLSVGGAQRDAREVTVENGQSTSIELTWETGAGDAGSYTVTVATQDDSDSGNAVVQAEGTVFDVTSLTVENGPITEGEPMCIACTVENIGSDAGAQWIGVGVGNEALPADKKKIQLAAGERIDGLSFTASSVGMRESDIYATLSMTESELERGTDPAATTRVEVTTGPHFVTTIDGTNSPVQEGETMEVTATVENNGGEQGNATVALTTGKRSARKGRNPQTGKEIKIPGQDGSGGSEDTALDTLGVALEPGESQQVTLDWSTVSGDESEHVVGVAAIPPWERDDWDGPVFLAGDDGQSAIAHPDMAAAQSVGHGGCLDGTPFDDTLVAVDRHGPMKTGRFEVQIDDIAVAGWQTVTIPGISVEQGSYREGNDPDYEKKTWGQTTFDDLEMERGVKPGDTKLYDWIKDVQAGKADSGRKEITVKMLDEEGEMQIQWEFQKAWVKEYSPPELESSADGEMATESITVAYDKMERKEA